MNRTLETTKKPIDGIRLYAADTRAFIECDKIDINRMVDEIILYDKDDAVVGRFWTRNIYGYEIVYKEGDNE